MNRWLDVRPSARWGIWAALGIGLFHLAIWQYLSARDGRLWLNFLVHWDAGHYDTIVQEGYAGVRYAFLPLYPLLIQFLSNAFGLLAQNAAVGATVSFILFLFFVVLCLIDKLPQLHPQTRTGLLLFLLWPASYVFHSHHTESLFLVLSYLAFRSAHHKQWVLAGTFAGLCCLTRNQGVFVSAALFVWAYVSYQHFKPRLKAIVTVGLMAALGVLALLLFEYRSSGNPLAFLAAQKHWTHAQSWREVVQLFWFGNPWQVVTPLAIVRHFAYLGLWVAVAVVPLKLPLRLYCAMSLGVMLMQGELINTFRYSIVLFPLFFALGDRLERIPWPLKYAGIALAVGLNAILAHHYALGKWAY